MGGIIMAKEINQAEFDASVLNGKGLVIVDFFATWCKPCQMLGPVMEEVATKFEQVSFFKIDIDAVTALAEKYNIMSVPTIMFFKDGILVDQVIGYRSIEEMEELVKRFV